MKNYDKFMQVVAFFAFIIPVALTGCGVKGSYTKSSTVETAESAPIETERQTVNETERVTKPVESENGRYYAVKNKDSEETVDEVRLHGVNGELYIEYGGKQAAVPWARTL